MTDEKFQEFVRRILARRTWVVRVCRRAFLLVFLGAYLCRTVSIRDVLLRRSGRRARRGLLSYRNGMVPCRRDRRCERTRQRCKGALARRRRRRWRRWTCRRRRTGAGS